MRVYLDSVIVIYLVEGASSFQARARVHLAALTSAGHQVAVSDLTRLECRVKPIRLGDAALLADFDTFLDADVVVKVSMSSAFHDRATRVRAVHNFKLGDSLHVATAVETGRGAFLTNDTRLTRFPDLSVDVLP